MLAELVPGAQLGQYRIVERAGVGGMAEVWKAYQPSLERYVAIKVLPRRYAEQEGYLERFRREALAISRLEHPNILPVHDFGEQDGLTYMVTPFIGGGTLADRLGRPVPPSDVLRILRPLAAALDYAHTRGIVHRDVKPSNVLIDDQERIVLGDFGVARMLAGAAELTRIGELIGTPTYMSPEQAAAAPAEEASDRYALGIIAYELLTGRPPFQAETPTAVMLAHLHNPLPPPRQVNPALPEAVEAVLLKALAKFPEERYPSATSFVAALGQATDGTAGSNGSAVAGAPAQAATEKQAVSPEALPPPPVDRVAASHLPRAVLLAAVVAVLLAVSGGAFLLQRGAAREQQPDVVVPLATVLVLEPSAPGSAEPAAPPGPLLVLTVDQAWDNTVRDLDGVWGNDWPGAIALLDAFVARNPRHDGAIDKLYAALVGYGRDLLGDGFADDGVKQLLRAQALLPGRGEASVLLIALTPPARPTDAPRPVATTAPARQPASVPATSVPAPAPAAPAAPPAPAPTATKAPFAPPGA